jgi:hypothetical protein
MFAFPSAADIRQGHVESAYRFTRTIPTESAPRLMGSCDETDPYLSGDDAGQAVARHLVDAAMPPVMWSRWRLSARKIWIGNTLGGAARCCRVALRQRGIAASDVAPIYAVGLQADRIGRIIRLGANWHRRQNCRDRQNRQSRNAHQGLLRDKRGAPDGPDCSMSIHVRASSQRSCGRRKLARDQ